MHLVGIIPIRPAEQRARRIGAMHVGMDIQSLLTNYFENKDELRISKERLIDKTMALLDIQDQQEI